VQAKHLNPYRTIKKTEKLLVDLPEGTSTILVRAYNRFEDSLAFGLEKAEDQNIRYMTVKLPSSLKKGTHTLTVRAVDRASGHTDCGLHNLKIKIK
jgi:methionine-rich copper-binding protein CopC